jgi:hypothetical protein
MTWHTTAAMARLGARIRFGLLTLVALLVGHDAVYASQYGIGAGFGRAMSALGHDGYWLPFTAAAVTAAIGLGVGSAFVIRSLQRRLPIRGTPGSMGSSRDAYRRELRLIWPRLLLAVVVLFSVQENIEALMTRGDLPGFDVLLGGGLPLTVPVLALTTLVLAAVGALVRWRIATLRARLSTAPDPAHDRPAASRPAREWAVIDAAAPHRWIPGRCDAGRAPPLVLLA